LRGNGRNPTKGLDKGLTGTDVTLQPLRALEATYRAFNAAERELASALGVPICKAGCGKCCESTVPMVTPVEAGMMYSWLLGQDPLTLQRILNISDGWILEREHRLVIYDLPSTFLSQEQWDKLRPEVNIILHTMPCPFLTAEKACLVHEARPLMCRAYGVTHVPNPWCPRPLSRIESPGAHAHIGDTSATAGKLRRMVSIALSEKQGVRFLPTALLSLFKPEKLQSYDGHVANAKIVTMSENPTIIFQTQLSALWREQQEKVADKL